MKKQCQRHGCQGWALLSRLVLAVVLLGLPVASPAAAQPADAGVYIPILAYHNISSDPTLAGDEYTLSTADFNDQLDVLQAYGYTTVTLQDYLAYESHTKTPPAKPVILTFDDGYQGMITEVLPALVVRGMLASFFIPTSKIGEDDSGRQDNSWMSSFPQYHYWHMIWPEVQVLAAAGMEIGSHSINHPLLNAANAVYEVSASKAALEAHLSDLTINTFAYPHGVGGDDPAVRTALVNAGYLAAVDFDPPDAVAQVGVSDLLNLPRRSIPHGVSIILELEDPWWFFMRRLDPAFPLPDISLLSTEIRDQDGRLRSLVTPGETIDINLMARNSTDAQSADVSASLMLDCPGGLRYDSHTASPPGDILLQPFENNGNNQIFGYSWTIPVDAVPGQCVSNFTVSDPSHLLVYYTAEPYKLFSVVQSPVSVQVVPASLVLSGVEEQEITFQIQNEEVEAGRTYFTVSISSGLRIVDPLPHGAWYHIGVGEALNCKDCPGGSLPALYEVYGLDLASLPSGMSSYSLVAASKPGSDPGQWLRYRIAVHYAENPVIPGEWHLRWPFYGLPDQQGWYAALLPVTVHRSDLFLPLLVNP